MLYSKGDVILVLFPFTEKSNAKLRPALVLNVDGITCNICQITHTDRSTTNKGLWVKKNSHWGKTMGILKDSFINLENKIDITDAYIKNKIGTFPEMNKIFNILNQ